MLFNRLAGSIVFGVCLFVTESFLLSAVTIGDSDDVSHITSLPQIQQAMMAARGNISRIKALMKRQSELSMILQQQKQEEQEDHPCANNTYSTIHEEDKCNGLPNFLNADAKIEANEKAYCLGTQCTTLNSIQQLRTTYIKPPVDLTPTKKSELRRKDAGDMLDLDYRLYYKFQFDRAGIPEPSSEEYLENKESLEKVKAFALTTKEMKEVATKFAGMKQKLATASFSLHSSSAGSSVNGDDSDSDSLLSGSTSIRTRSQSSIASNSTMSDEELVVAKDTIFGKDACIGLPMDDCEKHPACKWTTVRATGLFSKNKEPKQSCARVIN